MVGFPTTGRLAGQPIRDRCVIEREQHGERSDPLHPAFARDDSLLNLPLQFDGRLLFTWPNHRIAVMGPKQMAGVMTKAQMAKTLRKPKFSSRIVRRCELTGRARGVYRKFRISRIMLRKLALEGKIPGMRKSSW